MNAENKVYLPSEIDFSLESIFPRKEPRKVLICTPDFFDIVDVKNVHMEGSVGKLNKEKAVQQWNDLKEVYREWKRQGLLDEILEIPGVEGLEDMVFTANQSFPWMLEGEKIVIMSKMKHKQRQKEVPHFKKFYHKIGYRTLELKTEKHFEGMGDLLPHHGMNLLYGGYGHRTDAAAYHEIAKLLQVPIVLLRLVDERFYHLDTCFCVVDENTVMLTPDAFHDDDIKQLERLFNNIRLIPAEEADEFFALNAHLHIDKLTGRRVAALQKGTTSMRKALEADGFQVSELDTSEFMKSGGSVFCLKMMVY